MNKRTPEPRLEFSRPLLVARVPAGGSYEKLKADAKECERLAKRLDVKAIHALTAELKVRPWRGRGLQLGGFAKVDIEQISVVSLEEFRQSLTIEVERYFLPRAPNPDEELDVDVIENDVIDLGEVVAETLALELDPYPRKPGEEFVPIIEDPK
jgi:uncharacterized metal-binding protein YceD (DUF177 family)